MSLVEHSIGSMRVTAVPFNVPSRTSSTATRCATPECHRKRGTGLFGSFCKPCAERLAVIRAQIEAELEAKKRWGTANTIDGTKGRKVAATHRLPTCCNPYCGNPRERQGHAFCDKCETEGYVEEAA